MGDGADEGPARTGIRIEWKYVVLLACLGLIALVVAVAKFVTYSSGVSHDDPSPTVGREHHLVLPGWEDLLPGEAPPKDAVQHCERAHVNGYAPEMSRCTGCRPASLPIPCVTAVIDPGSGHVASVLARLDTPRAAAAIHRSWGTSTVEIMEVIRADTWRTAWEVARLFVVNKARSELSILPLVPLPVEESDQMGNRAAGIPSIELRPATAADRETLTDADENARTKAEQDGYFKVPAEEDGRRADALAEEATKAAEDAVGCAEHASQWCQGERMRLAGEKMSYDSAYSSAYGEAYPGQPHSTLNFDDRACRNRLTKLCERGQAKFTLSKYMTKWVRPDDLCVDIDSMNEWQCRFVLRPSSTPSP